MYGKVRKNKIMAAVFGSVFCMMLMSSIRVNAAEREIYIDQVNSSAGKCVLYVNQNREDAFLPSAVDSQLLVEGQKYEIDRIQDLSESGENVSFVCMVDVSGSMSQDRIDAVKKIIGQLADGKKAGDNVCITLMGNELTSSDFMTDAEEIRRYADGIEVTREDTNLYAGIKEEVEFLQNSDLHTKRYLIIFSDGADDQAAGITRGEAETAVKESCIPVFTVAMLKENPTQAQLEGAKILGSFARYSAGGQHFAPVVDGYSNEEVYGKIQNYIHHSLVVTADVSGIETQKNTLTFSLTLSDGTTAARTDYKAETADIPELLKQEAEEESVPEPVSEATPEPAPEPEEQGISFVLIAAMAGAAVVVLIIAAVIVSKRKKETGDEALEGDVVLRKSAQVTLRCQSTDEDYNFTLKDEIKIGRGRRCQLSIPEDTALSEVHCSLRLRQGAVYIVDENSTNGTYVNGVPIVGEYCLELQDIIMVGSHEYQIFWR